MSLDPNAWYTIQDFGNDFFMNCSSVGTCATGIDGTSNPELFQIASINGTEAFYVRPKGLSTDANGAAYCVTINSGQPVLDLCDDVSATWGIGNWNGQNTGDGRYLYNIPRGSYIRLSLDLNETYSLINYVGLTEIQLDDMRWGISSRAAINDQSYSTVPAAITGGSGSATTTTSSSSSSISSSTSTSSSSNSDTSNTSSASQSSGSSSLGTTASPSTSVVIVTPTVTATGTGSRTSSTSVPTVVSAADRSNLGVKAALALMVALPQVLLFCS